MILNSPTISGSLTVTGNIIASGSITLSGSVASASYASNAELLDGLDSTVFTLTSSFAAQTASFTAFTASILSYTSSQNILNGTYATTGSNTFTGIQTINSNLIVTGSITAQTLVVQTITSSVDFVTGSTRFGSSLSTSTHQFTGSVSITGSLSGVGATFSSNVRLNAASSGTNKLIFGLPSTDYYWLEYNDATGNIGYSSKYSHIFYGGATGTTTILTLANNGAATFASAAGITNGNGLNLRAGGNTASDANVLNFTSLAGTINASMFTDAANSNTRLKSLGNLSFHTGNIAISADNERMFISSSGAVGIGTSSPVTRLTINIGGANTSTNYQFKNISVSSGFSGGYTGTAIQSLLAGYDGSSIYGTDIGYGYDGTGYALMFSTNDDTSGNPIERMRITSGGDVLMGMGNIGNLLIRQTTNGTVDNNSQSIGNNGINYMNRVSGTGLYHIFFNNGNNIVGSITSNTTNTQFNTSSDYRLKKDLKDFNALNILSNIKLYDFAWKLNDSRMYGVLAHELKEILPYAVVGEKDELDENGNIRPQGVDYSLLTPVLVKAIQELKTQNDALQSRIETLESK